MARYIRFVFIAILILPFSAIAHVKWFVNYDTTKPPYSLLTLIQKNAFWGLLLFSVIVIGITSYLDRRLDSPVETMKWKPRLEQFHSYIPRIMRWGTGIFFILLAVYFPHIMLTPELINHNPALKYIHFVIAFTAFNRRSSFISGLGILFLYGYSIQLYGVFHMLDYFVFVGTAVYLIMQSIRPDGIHGLEIELLRFTMAYSFLWGAIEKIMQPELFYQLLENHAYLTMGFSWPFFVLASGFVEFACAWHIYSGKLAGYAGIGLMMFLVTAAVIPFGVIDFIGHFLFIVPLLAVLFSPRERLLFATTIGNTIGYLFSFIMFLAAGYVSYYILHYHLHLNLFSF